MAQQLRNLLSFLGHITWGDLGPLTIYRNKRGRMVAFTKAPPLSPPSDRQIANRDLWRCAAEAWSRQDRDRQKRWERASKRQSLCITGYNLWIYWYTTCDHEAIRTLEQQTGLDLLPAWIPPHCQISSSSGSSD